MGKIYARRQATTPASQSSMRSSRQLSKVPIPKSQGRLWGVGSFGLYDSILVGTRPATVGASIITRVVPDIATVSCTLNIPQHDVGNYICPYMTQGVGAHCLLCI